MQAQIDINQVVFQTIRDRFQYHENTEADFDNNSTRFLLREDIEGSAENLERVRSIMEAHTRLSDEQLQEVLNLRPATEEGITESTWTLYVRSWTVPAATMGRLLGEWQDLYEFPETEGWLNLAREFNDEPMHLRYVGVVTGRAAVERHQEDISHAYGILGRFLNGLEEIDQATFDAARIYEFARRETTETPGPVRELMERIGIAFFGVERVLNVQHGGYLNTYEPDMATVQHLSAYGAGFFVRSGTKPMATKGTVASHLLIFSLGSTPSSSSARR
ncbi:hypothetical protein BCR43DRAFT_299891 [Syncephalastrum racemosum]|uniref:Uncharacterized protein n=1 Tax=Syncephalastrum racemosum TaxID=13706 RepID=A0A1X2H9P6_SYNRA|nr:hypothetical protein BCR43DRAFT_299891 [Syncephalastrum racemosum]